jgi:hypothetical protein
MIRRDSAMTVVYPALGSYIDLWFARLFGHGLGNCFYSYFHAVVLAEPLNATIVSPAWLSLKIGPLLRGASSKRFYWRMFRPFPGEVYGLQKLFTLLSRYRKRTTIEISRSTQPALVKGALNIVSSRNFTFQGLHQYRDLIRERLLGIVNDPVPKDHCWGRGGHIAVHIRLGDFAAIADHKVILSGRTNTRSADLYFLGRQGARTATIACPRRQALSIRLGHYGFARDVRRIYLGGIKLYVLPLGSLPGEHALDLGKKRR